MALRVLIAEDEWLVALATREQVESRGHRVVGMAKTGEEALEACRQERPDAVFMDIRMPPGMDGLTATRKLMEECPHPVIIVTGNLSHEAEAEAAGAMAYIAKPLATEQIPPALELAQARFAEYMAVHRESASHEEALSAWRDVLQAVRALTARAQVSEREALERLKQVAVGRGATLAAVAREALPD